MEKDYHHFDFPGDSLPRFVDTISSSEPHILLTQSNRLSRSSVLLASNALQLLQGLLHYICVAIDFDLPPDAGNLTFGINEKGGPHHAKALFAVHLLQGLGTVSFCDLMVLVAEQNHLQTMLFGELPVACWRVATDSTTSALNSRSSGRTAVKSTASRVQPLVLSLG